MRKGHCVNGIYYSHHIYELGDGQAEFNPHCPIEVLHWPHPLLVVAEELFEQLILRLGVRGQLGPACMKRHRLEISI